MIHRGKQTQGVIIEGIKAVPNQSFFIMDEQAVDEDDIILGESLSQILDVSIEDNVIITPLINTSKELIKKKYSIIKVSGLFKSGMQEYDNTISFVSIDKAKRIFEMDDHVTGYIVNSNEKIENIIEVLNDFVRYPYYLESWKDRHRVIFEWINIQRLPIIIIFGLIALVAITNIMATISMIIREKNSQVGILMALGMKTSDIRKIFLFQGGVIGLLGCSLGSVSAYLLITLQNRYKLISLPEDIYFMDYVPAVFDYSIFFLILISTLIISIISTIIPTKSIAKIQPSNLLVQD